MWYKVWVALKMAICLTVGPALICGMIMETFGRCSMSNIAYFVCVFFWCRYTLNCYLPVFSRKSKAPNKKTKDNEVDIEDLK